ncbi:MAG TPA: threonylcarbamoyl-AMP synthase [Halothiobacillaceae bacterium]|nr:threonylcarbamoyl-AMP synthase [Halothiobacillaceae bacterium]
MTQRVDIHPETPQKRLMAQTAKAISDGAVAIVPTDSGYALACRLEDKNAVERIARIRRDDSDHHMTLSVRDLSELGVYAKVDNAQYRFLKAYTPSPTTFILDATKEVPRRLMHEKRKTVGLRVPKHNILQGILTELDAPLLSASLICPDITQALDDPALFPDGLLKQVDWVASCGYLETEPSTVLDLSGDQFELIRAGKGAVPEQLAEA